MFVFVLFCLLWVFLDQSPIYRIMSLQVIFPSLISLSNMIMFFLSDCPFNMGKSRVSCYKQLIEDCSQNRMFCKFLMWHYQSCHTWLCFLLKINLQFLFQARWFCKDTIAVALRELDLCLTVYLETVKKKKLSLFYPCYRKRASVYASRLHFHIHTFSIHSGIVFKTDTFQCGYWMTESKLFLSIE